jgi:hypothetical protein
MINQGEGANTQHTKNNKFGDTNNHMAFTKKDRMWCHHKPQPQPQPWKGNKPVVESFTESKAIFRIFPRKAGGSPEREEFQVASSQSRTDFKVLNRASRRVLHHFRSSPTSSSFQSEKFSWIHFSSISSEGCKKLSENSHEEI